MGKERVRNTFLNSLRKDILSGLYGTQGGLPGPIELVRRSGLSRGTINSILSVLEGEGLIAYQNDGYYVNSVNVVMTQYCAPSVVRFRDGYIHNIETQTQKPLPRYMEEKLEVQNISGFYRVQLAGERVEGQEHPLQLTYRWYVLPLTNDDILQMRGNAAFDPMWSKTPENLVSYDEVTSRPGTDEELEQLMLPKRTSVLAVWESIFDADGKLLMTQEITLSPRHALTFRFPFVNKPVSEE